MLQQPHAIVQHIMGRVSFNQWHICPSSWSHYQPFNQLEERAAFEPRPAAPAVEKRMIHIFERLYKGFSDCGLQGLTSNELLFLLSLPPLLLNIFLPFSVLCFQPACILSEGQRHITPILFKCLSFREPVSPCKSLFKLTHHGLARAS